MRTETLWQGERRAARRLWWRQVLERPAAPTSWDEVLDEMVVLRFCASAEAEAGLRKLCCGTAPNESQRRLEF